VTTIHNRRAAGFTLIEVIGAIALLGIAFAVLLQAMGASLRLASDAAERTQAVLRAQSLLDSAYVMQPPRAGVTQGQFDERYRWRLDVRPWQLATAPSVADAGTIPQLRVYRLQLEVSWGAAAYEQHVQFATLRAVSAQ
jgi:general secretion pathway protein I